MNKETALDDDYIVKCFDEWDAQNAKIAAANKQKSAMLDSLESKGINRDAFKAVCKSRKWDENRQQSFFGDVGAIHGVMLDQNVESTETAEA